MEVNQVWTNDEQCSLCTNPAVQKVQNPRKQARVESCGEQWEPLKFVRQNGLIWPIYKSSSRYLWKMSLEGEGTGPMEPKGPLGGWEQHNLPAGRPRFLALTLSLAFNVHEGLCLLC